MRGSILIGLAAAFVALGCADVRSGGRVAGPAPSPRSTPRRPTGLRLQAFGTQGALDAFLRERAAAYEEASRRASKLGALGYAAATPAPALADAKSADGEDSVTNVQHAGVDEGGIVKVQGDYLVVLRRGRLFTVRIGGDALAPVSSVDAFGPDVDPAGTWYDEMLVSKDSIVVIGYSYQRGGTELGLFDLGADGRIRYRATYHLRSDDYYSSRNYASRLLGRKLVFYAPLYLWGDQATMRKAFPSLRRWHAGANDSEFRPTWTPSRVYRPLVDAQVLAVHAVTTCALGGPELACRSTSVVGPPGRVFYVSPTAVYVWMTDWRPTPRSGALVYRLPLDGGEPQALRASGSPVDQFSFLEADGHLNVLLRADAQGDGMWSAEVAAGDVALLRVPLTQFQSDVDEAAAAQYRALPRPEGWTFQNRFVADHVLYGTGNGWGAPAQVRGGRLYAAAYAGPDQATVIDLRHSVDRIEALGSDAVVVGTRGRDLHFTPIGLGGLPTPGRSYVRAGASQGELRSHGFFYKSEGERTGLLGLPIRGAGRPGYEHLFAESAAVLFVRNDGLRFTEAGELRPHTEGAVADGCRASCVDWYGNARPLFLRGRLFALLGYELVEGQLNEGRIVERRRASFAPGVAAVSR